MNLSCAVNTLYLWYANFSIFSRGFRSTCVSNCNYNLHEAIISIRKKDAELEKILDDCKEGMPARFTYTDITRITSHFETKLGQGRYGTVYKGKLPSGTFVAFKVFDYTKGTGEDFVNEVATTANVHHVNVVRIVGFCADGLTQALVFEYLSSGSLDKHILPSVVGDRTQYLSWKKLDEIAFGTAKGIEYLHQGCDHKILHFHFDIKPNNILTCREL